MRETGGLELASTITLALQAKRLNKFVYRLSDRGMAFSGKNRTFFKVLINTRAALKIF